VSVVRVIVDLPDFEGERLSEVEGMKGAAEIGVSVWAVPRWDEDRAVESGTKSAEGNHVTVVFSSRNGQ
jgi:hypothetical protein